MGANPSKSLELQRHVVPKDATTKTVNIEEEYAEDTETIVNFDRESTGTSGYSSTLSVNSNEGQKLRTDFEAFKRGLKKEDLQKILNVFRFLKGELDADILSDYFHQDGYFWTAEIEEIRAEKPRNKQVELLLRKLVRLEAAAYPKFLQYLSDAGYEHVRKVLEEPVFILALSHENITIEIAKQRLKRFKENILDQLEPDQIADIFVEYEELTIDEYEEIITERTRRRKTEHLLKYLMMPTHTQRGFLVLMQALRETDGLYLLQLLQDGQDAEESISSKKETPKYTCTVKLDNINRRDKQRRTNILKADPTSGDGEQCQLKVKFKRDEERQRLEIAIKQQLDKCDVRVSINNDIILDKECLITSVEQGSLIITLKGCRPSTMRQLFSKGVQPPVLDILRHIFLHPNIEQLLPQTGILLEFTIQCLPPEIKELETYSDIIKSHLELLVEELDALSFLKPLQDKHILTAGEAQTILEETPVSRKTRTRAMIEKIIEKDASVVFVDILKEKKKYVWEHIFESKRICSQSDKTLLTTSYKDIVDNMSPNQMMESCSIQLQTYSNSSWRREFQAQHLLQYVLMQNTDRKLHLISSLRIYKQIPPEICFFQDGKEDLNSKNGKHKVESEKERNILPKEGVLFSGECNVRPKKKSGLRTERGFHLPSTIGKSLSRRIEKTAHS